MEGMQFLTINPDPDKSDPEDQEPRVLSIEVQPLDVHNFAVHWPEWCDQFKVYVAANYDDALDDKDKLSIFLKYLGQEGSALASTLHPQNKYGRDYDDVFDEVWWRMSELFDVAKDVKLDKRRTREISEERRRLMESNADEIDKDKWLLLIPHLSLCELEYVAKTVPRLEQIVRNHSRLFGVKIEKCCLEKYSVDTDSEVFEKYESISSVTLKDLSENAARGVLQVFKYITKLAMHNMVIIDNIGFGGLLVELTLVDCKIEKDLMDEWRIFHYSGSPLRRLCVDNFQRSLILVLPDKKDSYYLEEWPNQFACTCDGLRSLSIKGDFLDFDVRNSEVSFLSIIGNKLGPFYIDLSQVTHICLNVQVMSFGILKALSRASAPLKFIAIKKWIYLEYLDFLTSREYLWIMSPVNPKNRVEIDRLRIKTVVVDYEHEYVPPEEPNLIFDMLNEYCLLEITDYLSVPDWMRLGQLHWKVEMALCSYKYTRVQLTEKDIEESGISTNSDHFNYVAQFVTKWKIENNVRSSYPKSWIMPRFHQIKKSDILPEGLERLVICGYQGEVDWFPYFGKLNSTLRFLELDWYVGFKALSELHNLREIKLKSNIPFDDLLIILKQNTKLRRVHISFWKDNSWFVSEKIVRQIEELNDLNDLALIGCHNDNINLPAECRTIVVDLLTRVGPKLTKLSLFGELLGPQMISLGNRGFLTNVQELHLEEPFNREDINKMLPFICSMIYLKKIMFRTRGYFCYNDDSDDTDGEYAISYYNIMTASALLSLITTLFGLVELELPGSTYTIRFEMELREYLKATNRQLRINNATFP